METILDQLTALIGVWNVVPLAASPISVQTSRWPVGYDSVQNHCVGVALGAPDGAHQLQERAGLRGGLHQQILLPNSSPIRDLETAAALPVDYEITMLVAQFDLAGAAARTVNLLATTVARFKHDRALHLMT